MSKRLLALLLLLMAAAGLLLPAQAEGAYRAVLADYANLLSKEEQASVLRSMQLLTDYGDAAFFSTNESGSTDVKAERFFDQTFSAQRSHSGVIFLVDMYNREIYIFSRGQIEKKVGRTGAYDITDSVYAYASRGQYGLCATSAFAQVLRLVQGGRIFSPMRVVCNLLLAASLGLITAYLRIRRESLHRAPVLNSSVNNAYAKVQMTLSNKTLRKSTRRRRDDDSGGSRGGGFSGGGGGGGGGSSGGSGGGHRF